MSNFQVGIISGYFNPIHGGHLDYINSAKAQCDYLICIVNNDYQVKMKNSKPFMDEQHRLYIIKNIKSVDRALLSIDRDSSVSKTLCQIVNDLFNSEDDCDFIFFNSGDRSVDNQNEEEIEVCKSINIRRVFIDLPKKYSSSQLKGNLSS